MSGIDRSTSAPTTPRTSTTSTAPTTSPIPIPPSSIKQCHLVKRADYDGYGFNLHSKKVKPGRFIGHVEANSPAEEAGLKEGDRIIAVNGVTIGSETHKQVVERIQAIPCEVRLVLIDVDGKGDAPMTPNSAKAMHVRSKRAAPTPPPRAMPPTNGNDEVEYHDSSHQELPGDSAHSTGMVSTKRLSNMMESGSGEASHTGNDSDMLTMQMPILSDCMMEQQENAHNNDNMKEMTRTTPTKPPPQATAASAAGATAAYPPAASQTMQEQAITVNVPSPSSTITCNNNDNTVTTNAISIPATTMQSKGNANNLTTKTATTNPSGSLNLVMTAAEIHAKLRAKKKYDPTSESVDSRLRFENI